MKVLIVVDMQNDFIDGSLGTKEAVGIVDRVAEVMDSFDGAVICTRDTHFADYLETSEGRKLPALRRAGLWRQHRRATAHPANTAAPPGVTRHHWPATGWQVWRRSGRPAEKGR